MQKPRIELFWGDLVVVLNPPLVHVSIASSPSRRTYERLGPPRLFRGDRAHHLTIPLEPRNRGPHAGKYDIHLTYHSGPRLHHETVAALAPGDIEAAFKPLTVALLSHYLRVARRVTIESLQHAGYLVMLPDDEAKAWLEEHATLRRWKLRITDAKLERMTERFEWFDVSIIDELREMHEYKTLSLFCERDGSALTIGYQPNGLGPQHPPGWYAMPMDDDFRAILDETFLVALGPAFFEAALVIARELQAGVDIDALEAGLVRARCGQVVISDRSAVIDTNCE